jgi:hypothetical protein
MQNQVMSNSIDVGMQIFAGSFRGKVLFENPEYINPNAVRAYEKRKVASAYDRKTQQSQKRVEHKAQNRIEESVLSDRKVFALGAGSLSNGKHDDPDLPESNGEAVLDQDDFEAFSDSHDEEDAALDEQMGSEDE